MDDKLTISAQTIRIISTIKFSNSDIKCLEKWILIEEDMMTVTCPWFRHVVGNGGKDKRAKFEKIYCRGKCYEIFDDSFYKKKCPCWVNGIPYVMNVVMHIIKTNRPWYERLIGWLNDLSL
jgi:hypothetical protein